MLVDADEEGIARGDVLRVRVELPLDQPLVRTIFIKENQEDEIGVWYEVKYEKITHFCFGCGRLFHGGEKCVNESVAKKEWGGWLRASPRKSRSPQLSSSKQGMGCSSWGSKSCSSGSMSRDSAIVREAPTRRPLFESA